jgi:protein involved in polysaccharide export with SLBB domain
MLLSLLGCNKILEPVSFIVSDANKDTLLQEEFSISIETLTFKNAQKANKAPYPRKVMLKGSGSKANVINEANFLKNRVPKLLQSTEYRLGFGDEVVFSQFKEYIKPHTKWPPTLPPSEYLIGIGDELTFLSLTDVEAGMGFGINGNPIRQYENVLRTEGIVGSNGNVLLLGLGSIKADNRSLSDIQIEIRNILIRNGLAPNFQLEITEFISKKVFITINEESEAIPITNLAITLKEIALGAGLSQTSRNSSLISITRDGETYNLTAEQLFAPKASEIILQNEDHIKINVEFENLGEVNQIINSVVGINGNILLPNVGSIRAVGKTLNELNIEVSKVLEKKDLKPNFQLELSEFQSQKAFLIIKANIDHPYKTIPLSNTKLSLKEIMFNNELQSLTEKLTVVTLRRGDQVYRMPIDEILNSKKPNIWIKNNDQIEIESLDYKPGQVFAIAGSQKAEILPIMPSKRETLADVLFVQGGALSNTFAKRSEVYLLRGRKPLVAYHLDAQNVSRILVAAKTELRPNDIIFVAERPIISFTRTLQELTPLRILLRDLESGNIP